MVVDVTLHDSLDDADRRTIVTLLERAAGADGHYALNDDAWLHFLSPQAGRFAAFVGLEPGHDHLIGYAQISQGDDDGWTLHTVMDPHHRFGADNDVCALIEPALAFVDAHGGGAVHHWVSHPSAAHDELAARYGFHRGRDLLQMRIDLPLAEHTDLVTRPFVVGQDEASWVAVNNRAFAWHPEQGGWTVEALLRREHEPWFDPNGFLLHEENGQLVGFCWTKVHADPVPMGEIYVIAVDPDAGGRGLGRKLTVAGLASLAQRGSTLGMLFVDADNVPAVSLYEKLGFRRNHINRAYATTRVPPTTA